MRRYRPAISTALFVVVALLLPICALSIWAGNTIYDSDTFSRRAVEVLDNSVTRKELARRITEQLAKSGNQQAINFRPAFQFAVEIAADTDTFRSIFRNAVFRTHQAILQGGEAGGTGLDLSDSIGIITSSLQLPGDAKAGQASPGGGLGSTLGDVTNNMAKLRVWSWEDYVSMVALATFLLAVVCTVAAIWVSLDRRRAVLRLGIAVATSGVLVLLLRWGAVLAVERAISDSDLSKAVGAALASATDDLKIVGLWLVGYGVVVGAASSVTRQTPRIVGHRILGWAQRRRATKKGTIFLGALLIFAGIVVPQDPWFWLQLSVYVAGLWLVYLGVFELMAFVRQRAPSTVAELGVGSERRRLVVAGIVVVALLAAATGGFVLVTRRAANRAAASQLRCNGAEDLCNVPLSDVIFPASHNSMSSSLYPGWLFAEQISTIKGQLDAGIRAFLIDTHYGEQSTVRVPGPDVPLIITDRAAELSQPPGKDNDPAIEARAKALAARATPAAHAQRNIYLCHNTCETGAVRFSSVLGDVKSFLESHPDEVVMLIIQDATTPADTAAEIDKAGLGAQAATLVKGEPLPSLRQLINTDKRLLVFAEQGGPGAPAWYMPAYDDWFQETDYAFPGLGQFNCKPNRGKPDNPLFLVNHWVKASPPDPGLAQKANLRDVLDKRLSDCLKERGLVPNVLAVDFAERGDLVSYTKAVDEDLRSIRQALDGANDVLSSTTTAVTTSTTSVPTTTTVPPTTVPPTATTEPPPSVQITDMSGGDPASFCAAYEPGVDALGAWALASISSPPGQQGLVDLVFAPVLNRDFEGLYSFAPPALAAQAKPFTDRMARAMAELGSLGLSDQRIDRLAEMASEQLNSPDNPDAATIELNLVSQLNGMLGAKTVTDAATRLTNAGGGPNAEIDVDLGTVAPDVAAAAGYTCLTDISFGGS